MKTNYQTHIKDAACMLYRKTSNSCKHAAKNFKGLASRVDWGVVGSTGAQFAAAIMTGVNLAELLKGAEDPAQCIIYSIGGVFLYAAARHNNDAKFLKSDKNEPDDFDKKLNELKELELYITKPG